MLGKAVDILIFIVQAQRINNQRCRFIGLADGLIGIADCRIVGQSVLHQSIAGFGFHKAHKCRFFLIVHKDGTGVFRIGNQFFAGFGGRRIHHFLLALGFCNCTAAFLLGLFGLSRRIQSAALANFGRGLLYTPAQQFFGQHAQVEVVFINRQALLDVVLGLGFGEQVAELT